MLLMATAEGEQVSQGEGVSELVATTYNIM